MNILEKEKINPSTLGLLIYLKLNTGDEYVSDIIRTYLFEYTTESGKLPCDILEEAGYIKYIKTGAKSRPWERIRLSDKGEQIIKDMFQRPIHPLAEFTLEYVTEQYKKIGALKHISGGGKLLFYISEFLYYKDSYTEDMIKAVIYSYVMQFEYEQKYLNQMKTLFFKPTNAYATKWTPEECPICNFIDRNQDTIKYNYKLLLNHV